MSVVNLTNANQPPRHSFFCVVLDTDRHFEQFMRAKSKATRHTQCRAFELNGQTIYGDYVVKLNFAQNSLMMNDPRFRIVATSPTLPMVQHSTQLKVADYKQNLPKLSCGIGIGAWGELFG